MASPAYSFLSVTANIAGPGLLALNLGSGASVSEEGITVAATTDQNVMTVGADGKYMHTLVADKSGPVTVRLLKVSPTNGLLQLAFELQRASPTLWGQNIIVIRDTARNELITCEGCSFKKAVEVTYDKTGPMIEWVFDSGAITKILNFGL